jgi:hypothetical protein
LLYVKGSTKINAKARYITLAAPEINNTILICRENRLWHIDLRENIIDLVNNKITIHRAISAIT